MSFNNYGITTRWSDGDTPLTGMLDSCSVTCCPSCSAVLWKEDLEAIGELPSEPLPIGRLTRMMAWWNGDKYGYLRAKREWDELPAAWKIAKRGRSLEYQDLLGALRKMSAPNPDREIFLRRRVWWATNDHARLRSDGGVVAKQSVASDAERKANMLRMIELNEVAESGIEERAELLRQLGRFDEAIRLLTSGAPEIRTSAAAAWILRWAKARDPDLKALP